MSALVSALVSGLLLGGFLLLATLGFALTNRVFRFLNIAHAETMEVAGLGTWFLQSGLGLNIVLAAVLSIAAASVVGLLVGRYIYEPMLPRGPALLFITSIGVTFLIHGAIDMAAGPGIKSFNIPSPKDIIIGSVRLPPYEIGIFVLAGLAMAGLFIYLSRTRTGRSIRAVADNRELAYFRGLNVQRVSTSVWLISGGLAGLAGVALGLMGTLTTDLFNQQTLYILSAAILAGFGSLYGIAVATLLLGVVLNVSTLWISTGYQPAVAFAVIIAVLLVRPQGIFGIRGRTV